jgi:pimeloyl-ACP methyl ester carboxylesterase
MAEAQAAAQSSVKVTVRLDDRQHWFVFEPAAGAEVGLVFYPGGKVAPLSYAPLARSLAEAGYLVIIPAMPLNLAVFAPNEALEVIAVFPQVSRWVVGGHSLGGAMAAAFADSHPQAAGLLLVASYPAESNDLSGRTDLLVTSIYGSLDGVATPETILASVPLLPPDAIFVRIEGGNHAQFGWYGEQSGDNPASISRSEQEAALVAAALTLLGEVAGLP